MRPVDTSIDCEYLQRDQPVVYVMYSLAALAMLLFVVALVLLVRLRRAHAVRLGQPLFLCVMAVGGVVALVPIFLIPGEPGVANCFAPTVVAVFGFSLTFGCLLLKTYRIYRIWEAAKLLKRIALTTESMARRLCVLLLIDAVVLVAWGLVALPHATVELEDVSGVGLVAMKSCTSGMASDSFLAGTYVYRPDSHPRLHPQPHTHPPPIAIKVPVQDGLDAVDVLHGLPHAQHECRFLGGQVPLH